MWSFFSAGQVAAFAEIDPIIRSEWPPWYFVPA